MPSGGTRDPWHKPDKGVYPSADKAPDLTSDNIPYVIL